MRMHFDQLFVIQNGAISPRFSITLGGVTMGQGVSFGNGVSFGGVNLAQHTNSYFEVDVQNGVHVIKGIYN